MSKVSFSPVLSQLVAMEQGIWCIGPVTLKRFVSQSYSQSATEAAAPLPPAPAVTQRDTSVYGASLVNAQGVLQDSKESIGDQERQQARRAILGLDMAIGVASVKGVAMTNLGVARSKWSRGNSRH